MNRLALQTCYSFENKHKLFEIHLSFKFAVVVAENSGNPTTEFKCRFYLNDDNWLFSDGEALKYTSEFVKATGGAYLTFAELRSSDDLNVAQTLYATGIGFGQYCEDTRMRFGRELNMTDDAWRFKEAFPICGVQDSRDSDVATRLREDGYLALHEGKTFHQYNDHWGAPSRLLVALDQLNDKELWLKATLSYRLQYREIARATDERTAIACMETPGVLNSYTATNERSPWLRPNCQALFLCSIFNTFIFDWACRQSVQIHMTLAVLNNIRVPVIELNNSIIRFCSRLALRLTCNHAGYAPLWAEQLGDEWREGTPRHTWPVLAGDDARWEVRAAIDAVVAQAYGLSREQYAHVLSTFSHKSYPSAPKVCLAKFDELSEIGLETFTRKYDPYWDVPLVDSLPKPVIELPNLTPSPSPEAGEGSGGPTDMFGNPLQTDLFGEVVILMKKGKKRGRK